MIWLRTQFYKEFGVNNYMTVIGNDLSIEYLFLTRFLPPNFPNEIPIVRVSPAMTHPWINNQVHLNIGK